MTPRRERPHPRRAGFRPALHRPHGAVTGRRTGGWHDAEVAAVRPDHAGPGGRGPALRPGDLRGPQGVPARRRLGLAVPAGGERRAGSTRRPRRLALPELPEETSSGPSRRWWRSTATGCRERRGAALYMRPFMFASEAFLGVRPAQAVTFWVIARPAGAVLPGRREAGDHLARRGLHAGRRRAAPARPSAAATTPPA